MDILEMLGFPMVSQTTRSRNDGASAQDSIRAFVWLLLSGGADLLCELVRDNYQDSHFNREKWQNFFLLTTVYGARFGRDVGKNFLIQSVGCFFSFYSSCD
jgi:hypothetical protein